MFPIIDKFIGDVKFQAFESGVFSPTGKCQSSLPETHHASGYASGYLRKTRLDNERWRKPFIWQYPCKMKPNLTIDFAKNVDIMFLTCG